MKSRLGVVLTTAAALGSAAFLITGAAAQQQQPAPAPQPPASQAQPMPQQGFSPQAEGRGRFSPQDRAAFFDAHIAAVKAGLELTPDQQKLWDPLEQAVRDAAKQMIDRRQKLMQEGRPTNPVERLQRAADAATARGQTLHKIADAAQPLWASLSEDQKERLPMLMRSMHPRGMGMARNGMFGNGMPMQGMRGRMHGMMQHGMMQQQQPAPGGDDDEDGGEQ